MPPLHAPLQHTTFSLDVSGISGFFGGEESFAAMSSLHLMRGRRWMGWYNSPGSLYVAKKYGAIAKSRLWNGLFPGPNIKPAEMLEFDSKVGPRYMGVLSGTRMATTGHLAYLLTRHCELRVPVTSRPWEEFGENISHSPSGSTTPVNHDNSTSKGMTEDDMDLELIDSDEKISITIVNLGDFKKWKGYPRVPEDYYLPIDPWAALVTLSTIAGGVMSALWGDWFSFGLIILGGLSNGMTGFILGSGYLKLLCRAPSPDSPRGDGMLINAQDIIILRGDERSVSHITRGRYDLHFDSRPKYRDIGLCSVLLTAQFLLQLFIIPQGELIGQIMFLSTFVISWCFNANLASVDRETLQTEMLLKILHNPDIKKFYIDKWSTAAAFVAFYLDSKDPNSTLNEFLPNSTPAWNVWKQCIRNAIAQNCEPTKAVPLFNTTALYSTLDASEAKFVNDFVERANVAFIGAQVLKSTAGHSG